MEDTLYGLSDNYTVDLAKSYVGCFQDIPNVMLDLGEAVWIDFQYNIMTGERCIRFCKRRNLTFAGVKVS